MKKISDSNKLNKIFSDIKSIKIQGATNIAKAALLAFSISPNNSTIKKLKSLRPTEPMLFNVLNRISIDSFSRIKEQLILNHFSQAQNKINDEVFKLINEKEIIFTHCHSTNVIKSLINAHKKGKKFQVYNTETRPLYQGRKTAKDLSKAGINVTNFIDSALNIAISGSQGNKKSDKIFLGADAILSNGDVINKVGSGLIAEIARNHKVPIYIIADSWKFSDKPIKLEQRDINEIWNKNIPQHLKIKNPAFEKINSEDITFIVSDLGVLTPKQFIKKAKVFV